MLNEVSVVGIRAYKKDVEMFPRPKFNWDVSKYREQLDKQVELNKLQKQVRKAREKVLEGVLLEEDRRQENLRKTERSGNMENLLKSFYNGRVQSGSRFIGGDNAADSFIQAGDQNLREVVLSEAGSYSRSPEQERPH